MLLSSIYFCSMEVCTQNIEHTCNLRNLVRQTLHATLLQRETVAELASMLIPKTLAITTTNWQQFRVEFWASGITRSLHIQFTYTYSLPVKYSSKRVTAGGGVLLKNSQLHIWQSSRCLRLFFVQIAGT